MNRPAPVHPEDRITAAEAAAVWRTACAHGLIGAADTAVVFHDLDRMAARMTLIRDSFPSTALHAVAVKANPLPRLLAELAALGAGAEAASLPEILLAETAGIPPEHIVFDSPAKTVDELATALERGIGLNLDSLDELERVAAMPAARTGRVPIGLRINPQVGTGAIAASSVAGAYSKFGIPLGEHHEELRAAYLRHPWLRGVHLHIGSQGCPVDMLVRGIRTVLDFALEVNTARQAAGGGAPIDRFDIGGGLPVTYRAEAPAAGMAVYAARLRTACPELFAPPFRLVTEFGRYVQANAGWVASRVEIVKSSPGLRTAIVHVGADMFLRRCYRPEHWHHDLSVLDTAGRVKEAPPGDHAVAGPLCFSGDFLAQRVTLPRVDAGDIIVVHDAGAYTMGMWSRYNSRPLPAVLGYRRGGAEFVRLKERETVRRVVEFWQ